MQLDRIAIALRRRTPWQAVDLGFAVARRWWLPLWLAWTLPALLMLVPLALLLPQDMQWLTVTLVWWFKPLWDGVPLYVASRRLFGETVGLREAWRQTPRLFGRELLPWLSWRRLSTTRSADLPVSLLERLRGAERQRRLRVLHPGMGNAASWLTVVCIHFEMVLIFGAIGLAALMLPEQSDFDAVGFVTEPSALQTHLYNLLAFLAMSVVAPAYTMGGFMLYICRRVELEGWDIEIRFRDLAARSAAAARGAATLVALLSAVALSALLSAGDARADDDATPPVAQEGSARATARTAIAGILEGDEFHRRVEHRSLKPRHPDTDEDDDELPGWLERLIDWLAGWAKSGKPSAPDGIGFAQILEFLLWLAAIAAILYLLPKLRRLLGSLQPRAAAPAAAAPELLFGLDVRPESLPADVAAGVLQLWHAGEARAALALLYRATLARLISEHAMPFADHHTEGECVRLVRRLAPELAGFFAELTGVWQRQAYAHKRPDEDAFAGLCRQWQEVFGRAA